MTHWILIADASGARIVSSQSLRAPLTLVREFTNPRGRQRTQELDTDVPGRVSKAGAPGTRSAMQPGTTTHEQAAIQFAHELAGALRKELDKASFDSLSLVAPPHFLGLLRAGLDKNVLQALHGTLDRDLVHFGLDELKSHLEGLLVPGIAK